MVTSQQQGPILTFGEAMALFTADRTGDLSSVPQFSRRLAGADTNVAIGLARLGFEVHWLSQVGDDSFGAYIRHCLEQEGIDCARFGTLAGERTGLMFKEKALAGRDPRVEYFRTGSAASQMTAGHADGLDCGHFRHLHCTGITPALSAGCRGLTWTLLRQARAEQTSISFDPNLRPTLWPDTATMRQTLNEMAALADWVMPGLEEGRILTGQQMPEAIADHYLDMGCAAVAIKLGPEGSYFRGELDGRRQTLEVPGFKVDEVVDTVGAGDAFAVGFVSGMLEGLGPEAAVRRGNLLGSAAVQVPGDMEGLPDRNGLAALELRAPGP